MSQFSLINIRRLLLELCEDLTPIKSDLSRRLLQPILKMQSKMKNPDKSYVRNILTRFLPWDPLSESEPNPLNLFILSSQKDIELLPYSVMSAIQSTNGLIKQISIVVPENCIQRARELLTEIQTKFYVTFKTDEDILANFGLNRSEFLGGHPIMITLKYLCILDSELEDNLVSDGDTLFLRKRTWSSGERIILVAAQEYQRMHMNFCRESFQLRSDSGYSFTTQSQLFRKSSVLEIINVMGSATNLARNFAQAYKDYVYGQKLNQFPADWQLHSDWTMERSHIKFRIAGYSNIAMNRNLVKFSLKKQPTIQEILSTLENIRKVAPTLGSLSLHDYK